MIREFLSQPTWVLMVWWAALGAIGTAIYDALGRRRFDRIDRLSDFLKSCPAYLITGFFMGPAMLIPGAIRLVIAVRRSLRKN